MRFATIGGRMMKYIKKPTMKFSEEWPKLAIANKSFLFTTARAYEVRKHEHYIRNLEDSSYFAILIKNAYRGVAILKDVSFAWANDLPMSWWAADTYPTWTREDVNKFLGKYYHVKNPFLIILKFEWVTKYDDMKNETYINDRSVGFSTFPYQVRSLDVDDNSGMRWLLCPGLVSNVEEWYDTLASKDRDWKDYYEAAFHPTHPPLGWLP